MFPLAILLKGLVTRGELHVVDHTGRTHVFGTSSKTCPPVILRVQDASLYWKIALHPSLHIGNAYVDGALTIEQGSLRQFLELLLESGESLYQGRRGDFVRALEEFIRLPAVFNNPRRAKSNVERHYDLSDDLYRLFLDSDMQYSCGYFRSEDDDLETAQLAKKRHLAAKLLLAPGQRVLDIGSGWGGLALYLAREYNVHVTGLTLSTHQYRIATERARRAGLSDRVKFKLLDYRLEIGCYDRIVSVGMFEHVGRPQYRRFFEQVRSLLAADGVALIHSIGRYNPPAPINIWIRNNIFPGAYLPSLSQIAPITEKLGLWITDFESLRLHYALTLDNWAANFARNRDRVRALYDEKFCRKWEFYLQSCAAGFRKCGLTVFQVQLAKDITAVPITRDYLFEEERRLMLRETAEQPRMAGE